MPHRCQPPAATAPDAPKVFPFHCLLPPLTPMSRFTWSTVGLSIALGLLLTLTDAGPFQTRLLVALSGFYATLLAVGSLWPRLDFYLPAVRRGPMDQQKVALTFDDGPDPAITPRLLELLRRERISAAFFFVGEAARRYPELVVQAAADGHLIGNHSDQHRYDWAFSSTRQLFAEFATANRTLTDILGEAPRFVRTPAGVSRPDLVEVLHRLQLRNISWDVRGLELWHRHPERIANGIAARTRNGSIVLLHERHYGMRRFQPDQALTTTQLTIDCLRARHFRFVRLDVLLSGQSDRSPVESDLPDVSPETGTCWIEPRINRSGRYHSPADCS